MSKSQFAESMKTVGLLTLREVAELLAVSLRTVHRLISSGALPVPVKVGRSSRMPREDVQQYIDGLKLNRSSQ